MAKKIIYSVIGIISIIFIIFSFILTYQMGALSDEFPSRANFSLYTWLPLLFSLISFIYCLYFLLSKSKAASGKQTVFYIISVLLVILSAVFIATNYVNIQKINNEYKDKYDTSLLSYVENINIEDLESIISDKQSAIVYIGRDDCSECAEVYPDLSDICNKQKKLIYYYNTMYDRDLIPDKMYKILDDYKVYSVPAIAIVKDGIIERSFYGDSVVKDIKKYI